MASKHAGVWAAVAVLLIAGWQWATVRANYGGNWTALYCTGGLQRHPPLLEAEHVYVFADSTGYDGQFYHYVAHDPFLRSALPGYVDDPALRYRRILLPLTAYVLALGNSAWVDAAYEIAFLAALGLGVYWSCRLAERFRLSPAWGLVFLGMPAIPISTDRLLVDGLLATLTAGVLLYAAEGSRKVFAILICAALARETGVVLVVAYAMWMGWQKRIGHAALVLATALPAAAWYGYVHSRTIAGPFGNSLVPLSAIWTAWRHPAVYPPGTPYVAAVGAADAMALAGAVLAFGLAGWVCARGPLSPARLTALVYAAVGIVLQRTELWQHVYHFGRIYTPLLLCLAAIAAERRSPWLLAPALMMAPRIAIQLAPQVLGVLRWLA